jgi:hypothetical protein
MREPHAGDRFRAVADLAFDQREALAKGGRLAALSAQGPREFLLETSERVRYNIGMQDLRLQAGEELPLKNHTRNQEIIRAATVAVAGVHRAAVARIVALPFALSVAV